jgi:hypothetical protein
VGPNRRTMDDITTPKIDQVERRGGVEGTPPFNL